MALGHLGEGFDLCTTGTHRTRRGRGGAVAFNGRTPVGRRLGDAFAAAPNLFEPVSAWVAGRGALRRVGPFGPAMAVRRVPVVDWLLRAWRAGLRHVDEPRVTVLKDNVRAAVLGRTRYEEVSPFFDTVEDIARGRDPDAIRAEVGRRHALYVAEGREPAAFARLSPHAGLAAALAGRLGPEAAARFLSTGEDPYGAALDEAGLPAGWPLGEAIAARTGEAMPRPPALADMVAAARAQLGEAA